MNQAQSAQETGKTTKVIDKQFVVDYRKRLGGGSYSQVYCAVSRTHPQVPLACKNISKEELNKQIQNTKGNRQSKNILRTYLIQRIKSQIKIAQQLNHPNIVQFVHFSQTKNNIYIFMQKCQSTLEDLIMKKGPMPEKKAIYFARDIIDAACWLYDKSITHRDIKSSNILLQNGVAKLADFGFAKELEEKDQQSPGTQVGTMLYMAPQLIFDEKPEYSIKCDIWSIGVVIYFMLYGYLPWESNQQIRSFKIALRQPIKFSSSIEVSPLLRNLISQMLIFNDKERIHIKDAKVLIDEIISKYEAEKMIPE